MAKRKYFTYAVLGHIKDDQGNWETNEITEPTVKLAESAEDIQMEVLRSLSDEQVKTYGVKNLDIVVKPF